MKHLVFVYNADSGLFNTMADIAHKIISPSTYSCQLCALTHSYFTARKEWTPFLDELDAELEFLHRDELQKKYGIKEITLPVILLKNDAQLSTWISTKEINDCQSIDTLKLMISEKLKD
ncbi:MAG: hypothetical protein OEY52_08805 [Gammaproteobacteria bacterium]|nr:hypothetical protein [Gammaproteobacteria bacterium]